MKRMARVLIVLALVAAGFAGGYVFRSKQPDPTIQDYALSNVLSDLVFISLIDDNKPGEVRGLLDVRLFDDVTHERKSDGVISDPDFLKTRMRTLAGVAKLWNELPPPNSNAMVSAKVQSWFAEWESIYELNLKLVRAAEADCRAVSCSPNFGGHRTVSQPPPGEPR
jgi:hypothetical protein